LKGCPRRTEVRCSCVVLYGLFRSSATCVFPFVFLSCVFACLHRVRECALLQPWQALRYNRPHILPLSFTPRFRCARLLPLVAPAPCAHPRSSIVFSLSLLQLLEHNEIAQTQIFPSCCFFCRAFFPSVGYHCMLHTRRASIAPCVLPFCAAPHGQAAPGSCSGLAHAGGSGGRRRRRRRRREERWRWWW
jgi:hypothetical protein